MTKNSFWRLEEKMKKDNTIKDTNNIQIAYIGGGSRAWARNLMNDLAKESELAGCVRLYDIDIEAAKLNEKIGNQLSARDDVVGKWKYQAYEKMEDALIRADFVFISILPGTFDDMASDVHTPEEYGIYQSVGDTTGPGGIIRSLRTLPMIRDIALAIKEYCPKAWVINFTNPMTTITRALYKVFPEIKAFGCCHEVFGTQKLLARILDEKLGIKAKREEIRINVVGVNHFTFLTEAKYKGMDLLPIYNEYIDEHPDGLERTAEMLHWANGRYLRTELVKFTLFKRYGAIAAAGDRHLAEFCPGHWFLHDRKTVSDEYGFALTAVEWRKEELTQRIQKQLDNANGEKFELYDSGEEMVAQLKALLGLGDFVTNVNIPNVGQVTNNPIGAVVETNALFSGDSVRPVFAGNVPQGINALVMRIIEEQEMVVDAALNGDYEKAFIAFLNNPNVCLPVHEARNLFDKMLYNVKEQLPYYAKYVEQRKTGFQH